MKTVSVPWQEEIVFKAFLYCLWIYFFFFFFDFFKIIPTWSKMACQRKSSHKVFFFFFQRRRLRFIQDCFSWFLQADKKNPVFYFLIQRTRSSAHSAGFQGKPTSVLQCCFTPLRRHPACSFQLMGCSASHSSCRPRQHCPHPQQPAVSRHSSRQALSGATPATTKTWRRKTPFPNP